MRVLRAPHSPSPLNFDLTPVLCRILTSLLTVVSIVFLLLLCVVQKQLPCAAVVVALFEGPLLPGRPWPFSGGFAFLSGGVTDVTACGVMGECEQTECENVAQ